MKKTTKQFLFNAISNALKGGIGAAYQISIAAIASRSWSGIEFSSWVLALSIAAIVPLFGANLSSVVARRLIEVRHGASGTSEILIIQSARLFAQHLSLIALSILFLAGICLKYYNKKNEGSTVEFIVTLSSMLIANIWLVFYEYRFGRYLANQKNWLSLLLYGTARVGGILGLLTGLFFCRHNVTIAAVGLCLGTWGGLWLLNFITHQSLFDGPLCQKTRSLEVGLEYSKNQRLLSGFFIGSLSMFAVQYSIPPIVSIIDPDRFNAFYLATTINTVAVGFLGAASSVLVIPLTKIIVRSELRSLRSFFVWSPVLCGGVCLSIFIAFLLLINPIINAFKINVEQAKDVRFFLFLLGLHSIIRATPAGFGMYIASSGTGRNVATPLIIESVLALAVAAPLGWMFGVNILIIGLILATLAATLTISRVVRTIEISKNFSSKKVFSWILLNQIFCSGIWWFIAKKI